MEHILVPTTSINCPKNLPIKKRGKKEFIYNFLWLWKVSQEICSQETSSTSPFSKIYNAIRIFKNRLLFMAKSIRLLSALRPFLHSIKGSPINNLISQRPETVGAIVWPYQCISWDAITRLKQIEMHFNVIETSFPKLEFPINGKINFINLDDIYENLNIVIDRPKWFMREGQLVINLFLADTRIYSLAFSFSLKSNQIVAYVGALQGRNIDDVLNTYKKITKALHGLRPQDFLFEIFRIFCSTVGIDKILAVSDSSRQHRSSYFAKTEGWSKTTVNYDRIWLERGGTLDTSDFFIFGVEPNKKNIEEIPSHKRSMYRQRYTLLNTIGERIQNAYAQLG